jgi:hypothetical protein
MRSVNEAIEAEPTRRFTFAELVTIACGEPFITVTSRWRRDLGRGRCTVSDRARSTRYDGRGAG